MDLQQVVPTAPFTLSTSCAGHAHIFALDVVVRSVAMRDGRPVAWAERIFVASEADGHNLAATLLPQARESGIHAIAMTELSPIALN